MDQKTVNIPDQLSMGHTALIGELTAIHKDFQLNGEPQNTIFSLPDEILNYIISLLRDETPAISQLPPEQWAGIITVIKDHGLSTFLFKKIHSLPKEYRPPENIYNELGMASLNGRAHFMIMGTRLREITDLFTNHGITTIVLKGNAVAYSVYADPVMRLSTDIDLLLNPSDVPAARALLEKNCYVCLERRVELSPEGYCEEVFLPKNDSKHAIPVELHWNLYPFSRLNRNIDNNALFNRAIKVETTGLSFYSLDIIDSLIHSSMHMIYNHGHGIRINWIIDVSLLARKLKSSEDWNELQKRSYEFGAILAVQKALSMAQLWTGLQIPYGYSDFSTWPVPSEGEIANFSYAVAGSTSSLFKLIFPKNASLGEKARLLFRLIFPDPAIIKVMDPPSRPWLWPTSYIKRWYRLIKNSFKN